MRDGHNQYAPMPGVLRAARRRSPPSTNGSTARATTPTPKSPSRRARTEGDLRRRRGHRAARATRSIVFEPCYDSYVPAIDAERRHAGLRAAALSRLRDRLGRGARPRSRRGRGMIMVNSPHNPTGTRARRRDDMRALVALVDGTRRSCSSSDEVYEHIIFDGARHESCARYPELARARVRHQFVRQDVSHDRLEGRLRRRAGGADRGVPRCTSSSRSRPTRPSSTRSPSSCSRPGAGSPSSARSIQAQARPVPRA